LKLNSLRLGLIEDRTYTTRCLLSLKNLDFRKEDALLVAIILWITISLAEVGEQPLTFMHRYFSNIILYIDVYK